MKNTLYTLAAVCVVALFGCAGEATHDHSQLSLVKTDDENSANVELLFDKYVGNEWDVMNLYAEDVLCRINNTEFSGRDNLMGGFKMHHDALYSNIAVADMRIHTEYWSDGEVWSRSWFTWTGQGQTTGADYSNRGHFSYQWKDGQIAEIHGYWSEDIQNAEVAALEVASTAE